MAAEVCTHVPWLADAQKPRRHGADESPLGPLLIDQDGREISTLSDWEAKRERIRRKWLDLLRPLKVPRRGAPELHVVAENRRKGVVRQLVRYEVEPGVTCEAYLLRPERLSEAAPGVVVFHSTVNYTIRQPAGLKGPREKAFGLNLARQGFVTFCPRNFLWVRDGRFNVRQVDALAARHRGVRGMSKMLYDAMVAVDVLAGLPEVDSKRIGAVGHSLGAKEVLYLAAFDKRITAAASHEGGIGIRHSNWDEPWYLGPEIRRKDFGREHHELLAMVAPRAFLLLGGGQSDGDHSWPFIEAVLPVYRLYGRTPRVGLLNHRKGHRVPREAETAISQWLEAYT